MVQISHETVEQTDRRLRQVIKQASFHEYESAYAFDEFGSENFLTRANPEALCLVRDGDVWSQLVRSDDDSQELFKIFSFHFEDCEDNSGFIGWLASHLKQRLGTGLFVTCGSNLSRGGIFDYWGCPFGYREEVTSELKKLLG